MAQIVTAYGTHGTVPIYLNHYLPAYQVTVYIRGRANQAALTLLLK